MRLLPPLLLALMAACNAPAGPDAPASAPPGAALRDGPPESAPIAIPAPSAVAPASVPAAAPDSVPALRQTVPPPPTLLPMGEQGSVVAPETEARPALHLVPAGEFIMGNLSGDRSRTSDERAHAVHLKRPLAMAQTEVTQAQWRAVLGSRPAYFSACGDTCPVERVSWFDAVAYANALSAREERTACYRTTGCEGQAGSGCVSNGAPQHLCRGPICVRVDRVADCTGYRLPTESEWEYAARGGGASGLKLEPASLADEAWFSDNSDVTYGDELNCGGADGRSERCGPHPVAGRRANAWGLHDLLGNVAEWCDDWYDAEYPADARVADPHGPPTGRLRVIRGGGWFTGPAWLSPLRRDSADPGRRTHGVGFRVVRAVDP